MNKKIPEIRFKEFTSDWEEDLLGNIYDYASEGGTPNTNIENYYKNGKIPFLKIEDTSSKYVYQTNNFITEEGLKNSSAWMIKKDSIIFTNGATIGNVSINKIPLCTKQGILGIEIRNKFNLEFVYYLLKTWNVHSQTLKNVTVGTIPTITLGNFSNITFKKPKNTTEQQKISQLLTSLDSYLTLHQQKYDFLMNIKSTLLSKMFPDQNSKFPNIRFSEFTHAWEQDQIKELFNITRGYVLATKDIFQSQNGENIYPVYSSQTLNNGLLGYYKKFLFEDAITWTTDGANAGTVNYREGKFYSINICRCFIREKNINLTYFLLTHYKNESFKFVMRAGNPKLMNNTVADITIKVTSSVLETTKNLPSFHFPRLYPFTSSA
ncbi:restriction endonuclease subunit S [Mycoplasma sp. 6243]|uniref:restriction endonuclease subunit S n=1 Tax=Mycoplasma sp. 6243 TaxID=3440865 RepID=UPI003EBB6A1D